MTAIERARLVEHLRRHLADERVLGAIGAVPRERFVDDELRSQAYDDVALPIGCGQSISQPLVIARMLELLGPEPGERVLDVGTGSGYHAALLAQLCDHVWTIERHASLAERARALLTELGIANVTVIEGDGTLGLRAHAPYDAINVAAAAWPEIPAALERQLAPGGRLVAPVGTRSQRLVIVRRDDGRLEREALEPVRFVPLVPE